jgi:hypothetical protein
MKNFKINLNKINYEISTVSKNLKRGSIILSNLLERPLSLYFFIKLKKKVKFAFFEHGETSGHMKSWYIRRKSQTSILGNYCFFCHKLSLDVHKNILPKKLITGIGGSSINYFKKKNLFKIFLIKFLLGIPLFKKNTVYVSDLFRNNGTYVPYIGRDLDVYEDTLKIIKFIKKNNKKDFIVLKQYPNSLYKDDFIFNETGVKTLTNLNWMHIYYIFDEVYFSAIQSSWLYKNQWQKIRLINRSSYPIHVKFIQNRKKMPTTSKEFQVYKVNKFNHPIDDGKWINLLKK